MRFIGGNSVNWNWMRNADVSTNGKRNTIAVTPERPCVPRLLLRQHLPVPIARALVRPLNASVRGDGGKQDKSVAFFAAPLATSARSAGSLRGTGVGSQAERKAQIEVAHMPKPSCCKGLRRCLWSEKEGF